MSDFLNALNATITIGSLYALIALGYTMVYGILKLINFAHSDVVVLGAWSSLTVGTVLLPRLGVDPASPPWWAGVVVLVAAMLVCGVAGFLIERFAYKPLRGAPRLNALITAMGVSLFLQNAGQLQWKMADARPAAEGRPAAAALYLPFGTQPGGTPAVMPVAHGKSGPEPIVVYRHDFESIIKTADGGTKTVAEPFQITLVDVVIVACAVGLMIGLEILVFHTRLGTAMRAVSYNTDFAALMGIPIDRVISFTFVLGAVLAAAAGFLYGQKYGQINPTASYTWTLLGLKAFVAAVVGGIGNVRGAVVGAFLIAFIEQFGGRYAAIVWPGASAYTAVAVFALLIIVLLVKPAGLFGSTVREKV